MKKNIFNFFRIFLITIFFLTAFAGPVLADSTIDVTKVDYRPEITVDIGGFGGSNDFAMPSHTSCANGDENCVSINWLANYIAVIYQYGIGLAAILAAVMILVGGFIWLTSFGSPDKISKAKEFIVGALTGLVLALFSYLILYTLNPNLVKNEALVVSGVETANMSCCKQSDGTYAKESVAAGQSCASGEPAVSDDLCRSKKEICEEDRKGIYIAATTVLTTDLNEFCEQACENVDSTIELVEEYSRSEGGNSATGCCVCKAKNDIGCCHGEAAPINWVTGGRVGVAEEWACTTRSYCLNLPRANMSFKEIDVECSVEYCKTLSY